VHKIYLLVGFVVNVPFLCEDIHAVAAHMSRFFAGRFKVDVPFLYENLVPRHSSLPRSALPDKHQAVRKKTDERD
jgi:hypothetical protein